MLPNVLTVFRIGLTFVFGCYLLEEGLTAKIIAAVLFAIASFTDFLDGYIARKYNLISDFGKIMDPIADKFLVLISFFIFMQMGFLDGWMFWVIALREIGLTLLRFKAMSQQKVLAAENLGKIKTVVQMAAISIVLIFLILVEAEQLSDANELWQNCILVLMYVVVGITVLSGVQNIKNNRRIYFDR